MGLIRSRFGTGRGLVRLALSYGEVALGQGAILRGDPAAVRRLVFVCQGNICRSAFADVRARSLGLRTKSFGLSTDAGKHAHPPAIVAAARLGIDLDAHRTVRVEEYQPEPGDLLLAMETRQLRRLAGDARLAGVPRTLLGLYATPVVPHLHDPYGLDDGYMLQCLTRIDRAVMRLATAFPGARLS